MTLFDATKGKKAVSDEVETKSHEFAALFDDLTPRKQRMVLDRMNELLDDPDSIDAFTAGSYAQSNAGTPAQALGAGPSSITDDEALQAIMASSNVPQGVKAAILRVISPSDPSYIAVETDGTPSELKTARAQVITLTNERNTAQTKLTEEQDPNKSGSLAHKLAAAQTTPATPADMVMKSDVKVAADEALVKIKAIKPSPLKGGAASKAEAEVAAQAVIDLVN